MAEPTTRSTPSTKPATQAPIVYRHALEALMQHVATPAKVFTPGELKERKVQPPSDLPIEVYVEFLRELARRLGPDLEQGLERVGREMVRGYCQTIVGRTALMVMRLLGPQKGLMRIADSFRTADNVTEVKATVVGERHLRLELIPGYGVPRYQLGLLSELLVLIGVASHHVALSQSDSGSTLFDITWEKR